MKKRPTIGDVAKAAGVSPATVSRVLNRKRKFRATPEVRQRIVDTARDLGYVPDLAARTLTSGATRIVGVFTSPFAHFSEGINDALMEGIGGVLHSANFDVFYELSSAVEKAHSIPFWRFDGAILLQVPSARTVAELDRRGVPYICINEKIGHPDAYVLADDAQGMKHAMEHLAQLGHTRVAYANASTFYFDHYSVSERYGMLIKGAREHQIELVSGHDTPFSSAAIFLREAVVDGGATGVISYDHQIATALVGASYELGLRIPHDFSLICFNDLFPVKLLPPPLTAIAVAGQEMGRMGADLLLSSLSKTRPTKPRLIRVPESLVVRASTAPPKRA
ncbi:MAG TPA: LacI family DNA-binding transcriptional regulator [Tepidisphaeraceae bacterium]